MRTMKIVAAMVAVTAMCAGVGAVAQSDAKHEEKAAAPVAAAVVPRVADSVTEGSVTVGGQAIAYRAVAGTITVGSTPAQDAMIGLDGKYLADAGIDLAAKVDEQPATARMFYTAYFKKGEGGKKRPVTFLYNGGPGSSTMWLHMGTFAPKRVVTTDTQHDMAAPYVLAENKYSLLDVTDLVFIDAPGTGYSRIFGKDKEKAFWGTDQDARAFDKFIRRFLTKYDRWNSPKYLFGESYGTTRSAVLSRTLQSVDLNGIILLSSILSFDDSADGPQANPGTDQVYALALPTYAATAFYKHLVPGQSGTLENFLKEVEDFALGEYMTALLQGADLPAARKQAVAEKLAAYTGLPVKYWMRADLRVSGGEFSKELQAERGLTTGRLDTRYEGPDLDPLAQNAGYDPQSAAVSSAFQTGINEYMHNDLKYGENMTYKPNAYGEQRASGGWDLKHAQPGGPQGFDGSVNVMTDLAMTMKMNPKMKVFLTGGYFDAATIFFGATYEMKHLPIPANLQSNISYHFYPAGHMIYVNEDILRDFRNDVAAFIRATESGR